MSKVSLLVTVAIIASSVIKLQVTAKLPEEDIPVPDLIRYWGYPVEIHEAKTDDGYYLTLHRIPFGKKKVNESVPRKVMFLQHGLLASSSNWVANFPENSLAFMLADAGYDVWLGNVRGNTYSKKHEKLSVFSAAFWDFSFDEMAKYDLPAMLMYVLEHTQQKQLYYVGHSQGTMMIFAGLAENQFLQERIKCVFALGPVTRLKNVYGPLKYLAYFEFEIKMTLKVLGIHQFLPSSKYVKIFADRLCPIDEKLCETFMFLMAGYDRSDFNQTRLPIYYSHTPAGTSCKNMYHFAQLIKSQVFRKYDYGYVENWIKYHSLHPPTYNFQSIKTPTVLVGGSNDWLASPVDVMWTAKQLPGLLSVHEIKGYNHMDFIWGLSAKTKVYERIIKSAYSFNEIESF